MLTFENDINLSFDLFDFHFLIKKSKFDEWTN